MHRLVILGAALVITLLPPWERSAQAAEPRPMISRYMLISTRYAEMSVRVDGREVLRQPVNQMSAYVAIPAERRATIDVYAHNDGDQTSGRPTLIKRQSGVFAAGFTGLEVFTDDGRFFGTQDGPAPAPGKATIQIDYGFAYAQPIFRFAGQRLTPESTIESEIVVAVEPQTARLDARTDDLSLMASTYLRVQPGYRYNVILFALDRDGMIEHQMVVVESSAQWLAQPTSTRSFGETGHVLEGRFQQFWDETGALAVFGYPLNDDRLEQTPEGRFVSQTFERNRFEYHPENGAPYDVLLGRLGAERLDQLGRDWRAEYVPRAPEPGCESWTIDGLTLLLCEPFLSYYHAHGLEFDGQPGFSPPENLALLGYPLTQAAPETNSSGDTVLTQWFERARLEYHPGNPAPYDVLLGRLGAELYDLQPLTFDDDDRGFDRPVLRDGAPDWQEARGGIGGHHWITCGAQQNPGRGGPDDLAARWRTPQLSGEYDLQAFIPPSATARDARYAITTAGDQTGGVTMDQQANQGRWASLGATNLRGRIQVELFSVTDELGVCPGHIVADAIRLVPR